MRPSRALGLLAVGHTAWGAAAFRGALPGIVAELPGSVGDGLFDRDHSADERAAAFWFMFATPMLLVAARLLRAAENADDRAAQRAAGLMITGMGAAGVVIVPRSGFIGAVPLGGWILRRSRTG